ncbi:MAG: hypothetical protein AAFV29_19715, partial [Myxococcota bacterium]
MHEPFQQQTKMVLIRLQAFNVKLVERTTRATKTDHAVRRVHDQFGQQSIESGVDRLSDGDRRI